MQVEAIRTRAITTEDQDICALLDEFLMDIPDGSILAVTSKIVSICEGRVVKADTVNREELTIQEAEYYLPSSESSFGINLTIKDSVLIPSAGIDESNGNGYFILWPSNPQKTANQIRDHLRRRFSLQNFGVIITDSKTTPLRWGTTGVTLAHSGFKALNSYINTPDIFGKAMRVTKANITDALAAAAVLCMGEGAEQTPLALLTELPFVQFQVNNPSASEIQELSIPLEKDLYAPILKNAGWKKGRSLKNKE